MKFKKINLLFGILLFIVFLITGYYMQKIFKPEYLDNHVARMEIRANHIYILFISLLNILAYKCDLKTNNLLNILFRGLLILSGIFSIIAFLNEHNGNIAMRSFTFYTVALSVVSIVFLFINELVNVEKRKL